MKIEQIQMTPALATKLLQANIGNRNLSQRRVAAYADEMSVDRWVSDGSPYRVSTSGRLLDGQHRLAAIIRSGATVPAVLITDLPDEAQLTVDTGTPRSFAHFLQVRGYSDHVNEAAAISALWKWENGALDYRGDWTTRPVATHHLLWETFQKNQAEIEIGLALARSALRYVKISRSIAAAGYVIFSHIDADDAEDFFEQLANKRPQTAAAATLARTMNNRETASQARGLMDQSWQAAFLIKAWNAYREGRDLKILKWTRGGKAREDFPQPV